MHWTEWRKVKDKWAGHILEATNVGIIRFQQCHVVYTRGYWNHAGDIDNVAASIKPILDALVKRGVLPDDNPNCVQELTVKQEKQKKGECTTRVVINGIPF